MTPVPVVDRPWMIRILETLPGGVTWLTLLLPIILSFISPVAVAYFIIAFDLYWTVKSFHISFSSFASSAQKLR